MIRNVLLRALPTSFRNEMYRHYAGWQIKRDSFASREPEYSHLHEYISPGDWVIDVGANVGHYAKRCSDLVGPNGRVIAIEPVPDTFSILAANVLSFRHRNVSPLCFAASSGFGTAHIAVPTDKRGVRNFYRASLTGAFGETAVVTAPLDALVIPGKLSLIKVDVEGHEQAVLEGARRLLAEHRPTLIVEVNSNAKVLIESLNALRYSPQKLAGSPNILFLPIN